MARCGFSGLLEKDSPAGCVEVCTVWPGLFAQVHEEGTVLQDMC